LILDIIEKCFYFFRCDYSFMTPNCVCLIYPTLLTHGKPLTGAFVR